MKEYNIYGIHTKKPVQLKNVKEELIKDNLHLDISLL